MQTLLNDIGVIDSKYQSIRDQNKFNIFSILRPRSDEVNLHSKFIAEMLNPKGSHGKSNLFLDHFIKLINLDPADYPNPVITREYRKIDILIRSGNKAIIIENKIWAPDQEKQLERYDQTMKKEGITERKIVYLTIDGRAPNKFTRGDLPKESILNLSYRHEIVQWLDDCLMEVSGSPALYETLNQYKHLVNELTGNSMSDNERSEVIGLLQTNNNILNAAKIAQSWSHIKHQTEWNFWKELKEIIAKEYDILPTREVDWQKVKFVAQKRRKGNPWYGIMLKLGELDNDSICLFIQRGIGDLYYGITVLGNGEDRNISGTDKYAALALKIKGPNDKHEQRWVARKPFSEPINFEQFTTETTLRLIEPEFRTEYIKNLWAEIKEYIITCDLNSFIKDAQLETEA